MTNDIEIKQTYEYLILNKKVKCFFDIGANYGTHSMLFLLNDIKTISFEPNPECTKRFGELAKYNNMHCHIENTALGDTKSVKTLFFPSYETWNGSLIANHTSSEKINTIAVHVTTIDEYTTENNIFPDLIKIDAEGYELNILKGGTHLFKTFKPLVIFESLKKDNRNEVFHFFDNINYRIIKLPLTNNKYDFYNQKSFFRSDETNFAAVFN